MTFPAQHISIAINCSPDAVYEYAGNPNNLPRWAAGLSRGMRRQEGEWIASSDLGDVIVRFAAKNLYGILDHTVILPSGDAFYNPMRVFANDRGSEVVFTLLRRPSTSDEAHEKDAQAITRDLHTLRDLLSTEP